MKPHLLLLALLALLLAAPSAGAVPAPAKQRVNPLITAVEVAGNKIVPRDKIMDAIFSRVGDTLVEEKVKTDVQAIFALGTFSDVTVEFRPLSGGTKIIYRVRENPVVKGFSFKGMTVFTPEKVAGGLTVKIGEILSFANLRKDIEGVTKTYQDAGYILARVMDATADPKTGVLTFVINEGVIEALLIQGNEGTKEEVIRREFDTTPGKPFNQTTFQKDLRRLFNLGFFSNIEPRFEPGTSPDKVAVVVTVEEGKTNSLNFGGGFGEREGFFGFIDLNANNLWGLGQGLLAKGQFGQNIQTYQFRYYVPWILPDLLGKRSSLTLRRYLTQGRDIFITDRSGIYNGYEAALTKPFSDVFSTTYSIGQEHVVPTDTATFESYMATTLGFSVAHDTRDFILDPHSGNYTTVGIRQGFTNFQTSPATAFTKYTLDYNQFFPVNPTQTVAFHLGGGIGKGDVPVGEQFYIGGANTVRGFNPGEVHTGRHKLLANLEYRYRFNESLQGVLFYDWGDAWASGGPVPGNFLSSYGFGLRLNTPLGPLRLDFGVGAGRGISEGITHFSIGHAF